MEHRVLFTASTRSHIMNFHRPYIRAFGELGWTVDVACGVSDEAIPGTARVIRLPFEKKMSSLKNFAAARQLRRTIKERRYDLICAHTALGGFFTRLAVFFLPDRPKLCFVAHGYLFDGNTKGLRGLLLRSAEKLVAPVTDLLMTMTAWDLSYAQKHRLGKRILPVPGVGVDFSRFDGGDPEESKALRRDLGIGEDRFVIVYAAEFSQRKNQTVLIRAMKALPERAVLLLAGDGLLLERCKALAAELGLADRVLFPGYIRDMRPFYRAANAAASSSRLEGLPFNVMEAMYCGLPVAASSIKGHADLLTDGETGLLYPADDCAACAAALRRLIEEPGLAAAMGEKAKAEAEQYRLERVLPQVMDGYESLMKAF